MQAWDSSGVCQWLTVWLDRRRGQQLTRWRASAHLFVLCFPIPFFVWISGLMCRFLLLSTFGLQRPLVSHFPPIITFRPFCIDGHASFKLTFYYYFQYQSILYIFFPSPCKFFPQLPTGYLLAESGRCSRRRNTKSHRDTMHEIYCRRGCVHKRETRDGDRKREKGRMLH